LVGCWLLLLSLLLLLLLLLCVPAGLRRSCSAQQSWRSAVASCTTAST
jgi:hypothetical protein